MLYLQKILRLTFSIFVSLIIITITTTLLITSINFSHKSISEASFTKFKKVVYVKHFGAHGDGIHDDTSAINKALNSGADAVVFEENATYKTNDYITLKKDGVTIFGNNATLFTDNDYRSRSDYYEWYFNVEADNITIIGLKILAKETILVGYKTQFTVRYASNVKITNCNFTIPATVLSNASTRDVEYSNADIFTGWHNITISNCVFIQLADSEAGGNIGFRDIWSAGCDTAKFTDNVCISNSHDEILALFSSISSSISNITISNNSFIATKCTKSSVRNVGISLGYSNEKCGGINGVIFSNNKLNIQSDYVLFLLGASNNVIISNNTINYTAASSSGTAFLIRGASTDNLVTLSENKINIRNNTLGNFGGLVSGVINFTSNTVKSDAAITNALFKNDAIINSNIITINNTTKRIGSSVLEFKNNLILLNDTTEGMFDFYKKTLTQNIDISFNTFISSISFDNDKFLILNGTILNGYTITTINNFINNPETSTTY